MDFRGLYAIYGLRSYRFSGFASALFHPRGSSFPLPPGSPVRPVQHGGFCRLPEVSPPPGRGSCFWRWVFRHYRMGWRPGTGCDRSQSPVASPCPLDSPLSLSSHGIGSLPGLPSTLGSGPFAFSSRRQVPSTSEFPFPWTLPSVQKLRSTWEPVLPFGFLGFSRFLSVSLTIGYHSFPALSIGLVSFHKNFIFYLRCQYILWVPGGVHKI